MIWRSLRLIVTTGTIPPLMVVLLHWSLVLTLAIGCVVVILMKGLACVADAHVMEEPKHGKYTSTQS